MSTLSSQPSQSNSHWLLTSLGVRLSDVTYSLDGQSTSSKLSPVALLKLLADEKRPQQVLALVTREAEKEPLAYLKDEAGCPVTPVSIPDGKSPTEIWEILSRILAAVPPGIRLTLDVTHAFRSLPFVYLTATLFLSSLRDVTIEGVYYGMLEARGEGDAKPLVDLSIVLRLAEWFYATRTFRETGQAHGLVHLFGDGSTTGDVRPGFVTALAEFSRSYASGLPLEVGQAAAAICRQGRGASGSFMHVPAGEELLHSIVQAAEPFELIDLEGNPYKDKREIALGLEELKRQARLIDLYLHREQFAAAIQAIREWMVNRVLLAEVQVPTSEGAGWLEYRPVRERAEQKLNVLKFIPRNMLTAQQRQTNAWWQRLGNARNEVAHCGFRANRVEVPKQLEEVRQVWEQVRAQLEDESFWRLKVREGDGVLLVSPVGRSRGALFTALKKVQARWLLPIASQDTVGSVEEIVASAGFSGETLPPLVMNDPHAGFEEIPALVGENAVSPELANKLLNGAQVVVNLTGGTTVMQYLAQRVAEMADRKLGLPTRTMAVVDRRSREEQEKNPYVEGEVVWLNEGRS